MAPSVRSSVSFRARAIWPTSSSVRTSMRCVRSPWATFRRTSTEVRSGRTIERATTQTRPVTNSAISASATRDTTRSEERSWWARTRIRASGIDTRTAHVSCAPSSRGTSTCSAAPPSTGSSRFTTTAEPPSIACWTATPTGAGHGSPELGARGPGHEQAVARHELRVAAAERVDLADRGLERGEGQVGPRDADEALAHVHRDRRRGHQHLLAVHPVEVRLEELLLTGAPGDLPPVAAGLVRARVRDLVAAPVPVGHVLAVPVLVPGVLLVRAAEAVPDPLRPRRREDGMLDERAVEDLARRLAALAPARRHRHQGRAELPRDVHRLADLVVEPGGHPQPPPPARRHGRPPAPGPWSSRP